LIIKIKGKIYKSSIILFIIQEEERVHIEAVSILESGLRLCLEKR